MKFILIADNDPAVLNSRSAILRSVGYSVLTASNPEQARIALLNRNVHVAILDLRLSDDDNAQDQSGLALAKDPALRMIPKIMLSAYGDMKSTRDAQEPNPERLSPVVYSLSKDESKDLLLETIDRVFEKFVRISWDLMIETNPDALLTFPALAAAIEPKASYDQIAERAQNMEDAFRKLFAAEECIILEKLLWRQGNRLALLVTARSGAHLVYYVVTCERRDPEVAEPEAASGAPIWNTPETAGRKRNETIFYTVFSQRMLDAGIEKLQTVGAFLREKREPPVKMQIEDAIGGVLRQWQPLSRGREPKQDLAGFYRQSFGFNQTPHSFEDFTRKASALLDECFEPFELENSRIEDGRLAVRFSSAEGYELPNPLFYAFGRSALPTIRVTWTESSGALDLDTVLMKRDGKTWLTDPSQAGDYPIWHNYAILHLDLLDACLDSMPLADLVRVEQEVYKENGDLNKLDGERKKLGIILDSILKEEMKLIDFDSTSFDLCLLFCALEDLLAYTPDAYHRKSELAVILNRLIFAGLLCEKIVNEEECAPLAPRSAETAERLALITDSRSIKLGKRVVKLTEKPYEIVKYLFQNEGKPCTWEEIAQNALGSKSVISSDEQRVQNLIYRIRLKIDEAMGPNPPEYLVTDPDGKGYMLITCPE